MMFRLTIIGMTGAAGLRKHNSWMHHSSIIFSIHKSFYHNVRTLKTSSFIIMSLWNVNSIYLIPVNYFQMADG